jgi:hypothetical protein
MEEKNVQEVIDTMTKELREHIAKEFVGKPNDEETRKKLRKLYKKHFEELMLFGYTIIETEPEEK